MAVHDPATPVEVDGQARVALAHAAVQVIAERAGVDLLHVKGPALDASLRRPGRTSSDADVLVRPDHVDDLLSSLAEHGWRRVTGFETGSPFQHAANWHHDAWGYVDVHRSFPGLGATPAEAFGRLWASRTSIRVAQRSCPVPDLLDQALLVCLHAARGQGDLRSREDLEHVWWTAGADRQDALRRRARLLGAEVALAAATDELGDTPGPPAEVALWRYFAHGGTRVEEWRARFGAAPDLRGRLALLRQLVGVNREYEAMVLGRPLTRRELWGRRVDRWRTAATQLRGRR